eukprot:CAMPEP_0197075938 /NCGR_PEP_ID=MMETSP1384-20130603/211861_1 /TAXON_ID=29189 /ORGANISM="Ammonia sp." /LENGTH=836 /DNA_ID=CAMNT_0042514787 /DNA_START=717 /DNA_END=3227 /DNA_ORIENTATION=+
MSAKLLPEFNSWIAGLDLSSPSLLEAKVDRICDGIADRLNPKNENEYIRVMQSHLLLECWSQIRIFIMEQFQKNEFFSNAFVKNLHCNADQNQAHKKHHRVQHQSAEVCSASICIKSFRNDIQIPHHSYLLLLYKDKTASSSYLNLNEFTEEFKQQNDDESKANTNNQAKKASSFPPHVLVQVDTVKMTKNGKQKRFEIEWNINLKLNEKAYHIMKENKHAFGKDTVLQVVPIKNLIYLQRDYDAVRTVRYMPLSAFIMGHEYLMSHKAQNTEDLFHYIKRDGLITKYFKKRLNKSQNIALQQSLMKPLTLIHGPPGSGKTKYVLLPILKSAYLALSIQSDGENRKFIANLTSHTNLLQQIFSGWRVPRIGVFAGSNQAIDEIILTILQFNKSNNSVYTDLPLARMGNTYNMNDMVAKDEKINLNLWIDQYLSIRWDLNTNREQTGYQQRIKQRVQTIRNELKKIEQSLLQILQQRKLNILRDHGAWESVRDLIKRAQPLHLELECLLKVEAIRFPNQAQRMLLPLVMNECQILFSTANYLGRCTINTGIRGKPMTNVKPFDFSLFDECCQMRETETLIALQYCSRAVLIGDPKQLQATILYHGKYRSLLLNSLFIRVEKYIEPIMINEQYRMHAEIAVFPSTFFYGGKLLNGSNVDKGEKNKSFHNDASGQFRPFLFFDVSGVEERRANSLVNLAEIACIENLLAGFMKHDEYLKEIKNIGLITPYSAHKQLIEAKLAKTKRFLLEKYRINIHCATVDEFQGSERDIIIMSCVRSNQVDNVGFLSDQSRINVAITRAKFSLWIIGNSKCLQSDATWKALLSDVMKRNLLISSLSK